jgi:hypothetical protein
LFVEDPGAANFVAGLPDVLRRRGLSPHLATAGVATGYLRQRHLKVDPLPPQCDLEALVSRFAPRLIVVGTAENPDSYGLRLIAIAAARRIPSIGVIDSSTHLDFRFRGRSANPLEFCPSTVIVPDSISRDGFVKLGVAEDCIVVAGHPHWDYVRATRRALQEGDRGELRRRLFNLPSPTLTVILFAAEVSGGMSQGQFQLSDDYSLRGTGTSRGRTEIVIEEFLHAAAPRRRELHLVLRLHPKHGPQDLSAYAGEFDMISRAEPALEAVYAADAVVGMSSMMLVEATLMGRPTLAILPRAREAEWLPTIAAGVTPYASTRGALETQLSRLLQPPLPVPQNELERLFPSGALERAAAHCVALLAH